MFDVTDFGDVEIVDYLNFSTGSTLSAPGVDYVSPESLEFILHGGKHFLIVGFEGEAGQYDGSIAVIEIDTSAIPEPSAAAALAGVGALGLASLRRRRRA
jgi:hypothetical protein